ncbi:TetR family transcriptional regulator [Microtetraspora sp. NBRC 13810]|uniref:TetR/AcrR family transcriptional regulator n=1 Tax=Microtetraspora sp. NBRC 13810 TaxID=3030990 RepID=UPI0024A4142E|nr:TetR/AcrR family transcriptional regulator [Microtetraspora sp. NBRC 13810]GLW10671.1 TetR family transcriptional regulator [Microtetraspora sp. NBRC 13810]
MARQALGRRGPLAEKRRAIVRAAQEVFLREGFARAGVDAIAAVAGVSKRTVYNHYADKERLFLSVIEETIEPVITRFVQIADRHLGAVTDLEGDLVAFGREWVRLTVLSPEHAALLRLVVAEATHFPEVVDAWRGAGADRSHEVLTGHLGRIAAAGLLDIPDLDEAARHLTALVCNPPQSRSFFGTRPLAGDEVDELVTAAIRAFLRVYRPDPPRRA